MSLLAAPAASLLLFQLSWVYRVDDCLRYGSQSAAVLTGTVVLRRVGMGWEELTTLLFSGMLQSTRPALFTDGPQTQPCSSAALAFPVG